MDAPIPPAEINWLDNPTLYKDIRNSLSRDETIINRLNSAIYETFDQSEKGVSLNQSYKILNVISKNKHPVTKFKIQNLISLLFFTNDFSSSMRELISSIHVSIYSGNLIVGQEIYQKLKHLFYKNISNIDYELVVDIFYLGIEFTDFPFLIYLIKNRMISADFALKGYIPILQWALSMIPNHQYAESLAVALIEANADTSIYMPNGLTVIQQAKTTNAKKLIELLS